MKQRGRRICVGLSLIIALAICVGILIRKETANHPSKYLSNEQYAEQLDVTGIPCTYADFIAQKGKACPIQQSVATNGVPFIAANDNGIDYYFYPNTWGNDIFDQELSVYRLVEIRITDDAYRFGWKKIGVGSTRSEVDYAYRRNLTCYEAEGLGSGYIDGDWLYVRFLYDRFDKVTQMTITLEL